MRLAIERTHFDALQDIPTVQAADWCSLVKHRGHTHQNPFPNGDDLRPARLTSVIWLTLFQLHSVCCYAMAGYVHRAAVFDRAFSGSRSPVGVQRSENHWRYKD
ncbi:Uncharacterised protein [Vibrio cholerae]|nr:Uncharacterised protein [Vibrio cholerae]